MSAHRISAAGRTLHVAGRLRALRGRCRSRCGHVRESPVPMTRTQLLARVLADCYCRLQPSRIDGIGVFAIRDIASSTPAARRPALYEKFPDNGLLGANSSPFLVRRANPFGTLRRYARPGYVRITEGDLHALPPGLAGMIRALFVPTGGTMYVPACGINLVYLTAHSGEELTVNYRTYGADQPLDFRAPSRNAMGKRPDHSGRGARPPSRVGQSLATTSATGRASP